MTATDATILVVDDTSLVRDYIAMNLRARGFAIITAEDGAEALRLFDPQRVDLVLLDIVMPEINGIEVCRQIRQRSDVPIVMVSGSGRAAAEPALRLGANGFLEKPFGAGELLRVVQEMLSQRSANGAR